MLKKTWWILVVTLFVACNGCSSEVTDPDRDGDVAIADGGSDAGEDVGDATSTSLAYFDLLREMREELRADPNYLRYERDRRVATGDPEQIYDFVRSIRTVPADPRGWGNETSLLYGARGVLRTGAGSMRDKVELFVEMMTEAGFEARAQTLRNPAGAPTLHAGPDDTVELDPEKLQAWADWLDVDLDAPLAAPVDPDGAQAMALADLLLDELPEDEIARYVDEWAEYPVEAPERVPIGAFRAVDDEAWTWADVVSDDVPLGEVGAAGEPDIIAATQPRHPWIEIALVMRTASANRSTVTLAEVSTHSTTLAGRQVRIGFAPAGDPAENLLKPLTSFSTFTPFLTLQGIDVSEEASDAEEPFVMEEAFVAVGDPVTIHGEGITVDEESGDIWVGDQLLPGDSQDNSSAVVGLTGEADGTRFREVTLRLNPVDAAGLTVERLPVTAFEVVDDGEPVAPVLLRNEAKPQILFLLDESGSVPEEFRTTGVAPLVRDIAAAILADAPQTQFAAMKIGQGRLENDWTSDLDQLYDDVATEQNTSSALWRSLGGVRDTGATACVMITDGEPTDQRTTAIEGQLAKSPPCVFLKAGGPDDDVLEQMAHLVGGEVYEVTDHAQATPHILEFLDRIKPYLLRYRSVSGAPGEHLVQVTVGSESLDLSYIVPDAPSDDTDVASLELVITSANRQTTRRILAGDGGSPMTSDEVWRAMLAVHTIVFEGEVVRAHEVLDEVLANRLGEEALAEAYEDGDPEPARDAIVRGARWMPYDALALLMPRGGLDPSFVTDRLRGVVVSKRLIDERTHESAVDLMPVGRGMHKFGAASEADLRATIAESLRSSIMEAKRFDLSAISQLDGHDLVYLPNRTWGGLRALYPSMTDEQIDRWLGAMWPWDRYQYHFVLPAAGDPLAFYAIDKTTGTAYGVIDNGTGGGRTQEQLEEAAEQIDNLLTWYGAAAGIAGASGAFGFWLAYAQLLAKYITMATIAIANMESPPADSVNMWGDALGLILASPLNPTSDLIREHLGARAEAAYTIFDAAGGWSLLTD